MAAILAAILDLGPLGWTDKLGTEFFQRLYQYWAVSIKKCFDKLFYYHAVWVFVAMVQSYF